MAWICGQPPRSILSIRSVTIHCGLGLELRGEFLDGAREAGILEYAAFDLADGVHNGGVIAAVEGFGDGWEGEIGEPAGEVHGELASPDRGSGTGGGEDGVDGDAKS